MRLNEHPPPHFHVFYGEFTASISIGSLRMTKGWLPPRIRRLVIEWATVREPELNLAWNQINRGETPDKIAPLD